MTANVTGETDRHQTDAWEDACPVSLSPARGAIPFSLGRFCIQTEKGFKIHVDSTRPHVLHRREDGVRVEEEGTARAQAGGGRAQAEHPCSPADNVEAPAADGRRHTSRPDPPPAQ